MMHGSRHSNQCSVWHVAILDDMPRSLVQNDSQTLAVLTILYGTLTATSALGDCIAKSSCQMHSLHACSKVSHMLAVFMEAGGLGIL